MGAEQGAGLLGLGLVAEKVGSCCDVMTIVDPSVPGADPPLDGGHHAAVRAAALPAAGPRPPGGRHHPRQPRLLLLGRGLHSRLPAGPSARDRGEDTGGRSQLHLSVWWMLKLV